MFVSKLTKLQLSWWPGKWGFRLGSGSIALYFSVASGFNIMLCKAQAAVFSMWGLWPPMSAALGDTGHQNDSQVYSRSLSPSPRVGFRTLSLPKCHSGGTFTCWIWLVGGVPGIPDVQNCQALISVLNQIWSEDASVFESLRIEP